MSNFLVLDLFSVLLRARELASVVVDFYYVPQYVCYDALYMRVP